MPFAKKSSASQAAVTGNLPSSVSNPTLDQDLPNTLTAKVTDLLGNSLSEELSSLVGAWTELQTETTLSQESGLQIDIARKISFLSRIEDARTFAGQLIALEIANLKARWINGPFIPFTPADPASWFTVPGNMAEALDRLAARPVVEASFCFVADETGLTYSTL